MKNLSLILVGVFFLVTWKEWAAKEYASNGMIYLDISGPKCSVIDVDRSERFDDTQKPREYITVLGGEPQKEEWGTPRQRAEKKAKELGAEPHKYWDIKIKRVEETEISK